MSRRPSLPPLTRRRCLGVAGAWCVGAAAGRAAAQAPRRLSVAAFPLLDKLIEGVAPRWRERHPGVALEVISRQWMDHHTAMTTALSTASHLPDVMALEIGFVGRFGQGSGLEDLRQPPFNIEAEASRWIRGAYEQGRNRRGELVAAPSDVGPGTMFYRADVLDKAGVDPTRLSASWDSYLEAGRQVQARTGAKLVGHALELKDIVARTGIAPGDGLYYGADNRPQVTSARFVRGFTLARQVRQERLDGRYMIWTNEWVEALRRGRVATALSGAWMAGQLSGWLAPETAGLWRSAPLPEGALIGYGGSSYAIPRRSDPATKALAWDFIRLMTMDPGVQLQAFKQFDAFPTLQATLDDPFFDEPLPFLGGQRARRQWRDTARRLPAVPVHKQNAFAEEVVGGELDKVMDHGKDIAQALGDAARLLARRANR